MSQTARLLFDENFGRPHVERLAAFVEIQPPDVRPEVVHIFKFVDPGTLDEVWLPLAAKGGWIVMSGDRGKKGRIKKKGAPLPYVCAQLGITHVLMSPTVHGLKMFDKMLAILSVWQPLAALAQVERGSRFLLEPTGDGRFRLSRREVPRTEQAPPAAGKLFP